MKNTRKTQKNEQGYNLFSLKISAILREGVELVGIQVVEVRCHYLVGELQEDESVRQCLPQDMHGIVEVEIRVQLSTATTDNLMSAGRWIDKLLQIVVMSSLCENSRSQH